MRTSDLFRKVSFPKSRHPPQSNGRFTEVSAVLKAKFVDFTVKPWENFNKNASKVLVGESARQISGSVTTFMDHTSQARRLPPQGEAQLMSKFDRVVLNATNEVLIDVNSPHEWNMGENVRLNSRVAYQTPDVQLVSSQAGSSSNTTTRRRPDIVGEIKTPFCRLGSHLTPHSLTHKIQHKDALDNASLRPFFQTLSYAAASRRGVAFLSNYDETRFFKLKLRSKEILMSPLVIIEQRLDERSETPHAMQALLYAHLEEDSDESEFSDALVQSLITRAEKYLKYLKDKKDKEEAEKKKSLRSRADGASSSKDHSGSGKAKKRSDDLFPPVSLAMQRCEVIKLLGQGVTGDVNECDYDGQRVAVKVGWKYSMGWLDRDCVQHVAWEIEVYERLKDLQGSVIPRVIESGLDPVYSTGMVLITEKVGSEVDEVEGEIVVGGTALDRENLLLLKQKGMEGLRKMRARGVVHGDVALRNMRVSMKEGKVDRVWWIDLGDAMLCDDDEDGNNGVAESWDSEGTEPKSEGSEEIEDDEELGCDERIYTSEMRSLEEFVDRFISYAEQ